MPVTAGGPGLAGNGVPLLLMSAQPARAPDQPGEVAAVPAHSQHVHPELAGGRRDVERDRLARQHAGLAGESLDRVRRADVLDPPVRLAGQRVLCLRRLLADLGVAWSRVRTGGPRAAGYRPRDGAPGYRAGGDGTGGLRRLAEECAPGRFLPSRHTSTMAQASARFPVARHLPACAAFRAGLAGFAPVWVGQGRIVSSASRNLSSQSASDLVGPAGAGLIRSRKASADRTT